MTDRAETKKNSRPWVAVVGAVALFAAITLIAALVGFRPSLLLLAIFAAVAIVCRASVDILDFWVDSGNEAAPRLKIGLKIIAIASLYLTASTALLAGIAAVQPA